MKPQSSVLPADPEQAVRKMIELTRTMKDIATKEADALRSGDSQVLRPVIENKADFSVTFEKAGKEFHARLDEFRNVGPALIEELREAQEGLQALVRDNSSFYKAAGNA